MEQKLFTEFRALYGTRREYPNVIRIRIRMDVPIDPDAFRAAVDLTMRRYPYFCVELRKRDGQYVFADNHRPVVIADSLRGVELNSEASNYHMIAFSRSDDVMMMDVFHGLTDGIGAYAVLETLLFYYRLARDGQTPGKAVVPPAGETATPEEWADPVIGRTDLKASGRQALSKALNLAECAGLQYDPMGTVHCVTLSEKDFMRFVKGHHGSPATMISLLFCRAVAKLYPDEKDVIRIVMCVNQRKALHASYARHNLVGGAMLDFDETLRDLPFDRQIKAMRDMVFADTREEKVLEGVAAQRDMTRAMLAKASDRERVDFFTAVERAAKRVITATFSYTGKANFHEAEKMISEFRSWTIPPESGMCIQMSAVNGRFTIEFLQRYANPVFVKAFLKELARFGIAYEDRGTEPLELANIRLPWSG